MITKNDFIELHFTGRVKDGEIFDTNIKEDAEKINIKIDDKPFVICVGQNMLIKGFDKALEGKEIGKKYSIELTPKESFGERRKDLVKLMPIKIFFEKKVNPQPGMTLALDDMLVKIISVSGGRVLADFNNPLAGKDIIYEFTILKKVEDISEKVNAITLFLLRQTITFKVDEKEKKVIFETEGFYKPVIEVLNERFREILGYELVLEEKKIEEKKEVKEEKVEEKIEAN
ncbi:MAG: peptidylprolyl isomerase [Candidatus Pacearchaeota archaeon]|jgi:FKBP-type peptidyl-prolyl cis-trans isomerase SlyD